MTHEQIAEITHELNRAYCRIAMNDHSQLPWEDAEDWQKKSAINGVLFHLANPDASDSHSHDEWMREKLDDGWTCGPTKDPSKKQHPCLVPFEKLPLDQQLKDRLFRQTVHALAPLLRP